MNTQLRQIPVLSDLEKNFKLLMNSCYRKNRQSLQRPKHPFLVTNVSQARFDCNIFNFKQFKIFQHDMVGIKSLKNEISLQFWTSQNFNFGYLQIWILCDCGYCQRQTVRILLTEKHQDKKFFSIDGEDHT